MVAAIGIMVSQTDLVLSDHIGGKTNCGFVFIAQTLEACVKNCGRRFHQEIGKFKFLNELIKVVSPKVFLLVPYR